jgi:glycosyltransferase involved in cell wall biosynthesis
MKTSIIICAYNEETTVFNVVAASCKHNPEAEVIVVDDGSTDDTEAVLETLSFHYDFVYLKLPENSGKSYAMAHGVEYATGEVILFFNADVSDVRKEHFAALLKPLYNDEVDMVIGCPADFTIDYRANPYKSMTSQKVMLRKDLMPILNDISEIRFGVESYILLHYQTAGKRVRYVGLNGLLVTQNSKNNNERFVKIENNEVEIANTLLSNLDLITKRIQNNIQKTQNYTQLTITSVQVELNRRMKKLKERIHEMELV